MEKEVSDHVFLFLARYLRQFYLNSFCCTSFFLASSPTTTFTMHYIEINSSTSPRTFFSSGKNRSMTHSQVVLSEVRLCIYIDLIRKNVSFDISILKKFQMTFPTAIGEDKTVENHSIRKWSGVIWLLIEVNLVAGTIFGFPALFKILPQYGIYAQQQNCKSEALLEQLNETNNRELSCEAHQTRYYQVLSNPSSSTDV